MPAFSRKFVAASRIRVNIGACGFTGAVTAVALIRFERTGGENSWCSAVDSGKTNAGSFYDCLAKTEGNLGMYRGSTGYSEAAGITAGIDKVWALIAVTKASGTVAARAHVYRFDTKTWTHVNCEGTVENALANPGGFLAFGQWGTSDQLRATYAAAAAWGSVLSDAELEELVTVKYIEDWLKKAPAGMWAFNQHSAAETVKDLTGNGADQAELLGTEYVEEEPPIPYGPGLEPVAPTPGLTVTLPPPRRELQLVTIAGGGYGQGYDISAEIEDVRYSSVNPGGDERCTFTFHRSWFADNPEIARGNLLRVMSGIDILWQGRIEERDRSGGESETITVTAYGLGARLKDGSFREIFIDRSLGKWGEPSTQRKAGLLASGTTVLNIDTSTGWQDAGAKGPALIFELRRGVETFLETGEMWYYGGGIDIGEVRFDFDELRGFSEDTQFIDRMNVSSDDLTTSVDTGTDFNQKDASNQSTAASTSGRKYVQAQVIYEGPATGDLTNAHSFAFPRVLGRHGLSTQGEWPHEGFTLDQLVSFVIGTVPGVAARKIDQQSYVIQQASYENPQSHEAAIEDMNRLEGADWGTWAPDSPLDRSVEGQFDLTTKQSSTQHWFTLRANCDEVDLHDETSTLYGAVDVTYTTANGIQRTVRVSTDVPDLDAAGLTRVYQLDAGEAELTDAESLGEVFLAVFGQFAPARGSLKVVGPLRHYRRGELPPEYMRANGSNVRIPDILPSTTALSLDSTPDRRTTFPIKRVEVDCSGGEPAAAVELDQANDLLSVLQARMGLAQELRAT